jgi:hypothetical protein
MTWIEWKNLATTGPNTSVGQYNTSLQSLAASAVHLHNGFIMWSISNMEYYRIFGVECAADANKLVTKH